MGKRWQTAGLTGWPVQRSTSEDMDVQVKDGLSAVSACINDRAVAVFQTQLSCDDGDHLQEVSAEFSVSGGEFSEGGDRLFGNQQDVHGGLRADVVKGHAVLVFVNDAGRDFAIDDFLEDGHVSTLSGEMDAVGT